MPLASCYCISVVIPVVSKDFFNTDVLCLQGVFWRKQGSRTLKMVGRKLMFWRTGNGW